VEHHRTTYEGSLMLNLDAAGNLVLSIPNPPSAREPTNVAMLPPSKQGFYVIDRKRDPSFRSRSGGKYTTPCPKGHIL
jgi:hypothetical protein